MTKSRHTPRYRRLLELLVKRRLDAGVSQTALAGLLDKPQSYVSKYEMGERRLDIVELIDVAAAIGCPVVDIVEELLVVGSSESQQVKRNDAQRR